MSFQSALKSKKDVSNKNYTLVCDQKAADKGDMLISKIVVVGDKRFKFPTNRGRIYVKYCK